MSKNSVLEPSGNTRGTATNPKSPGQGDSVQTLKYLAMPDPTHPEIISGGTDSHDTIISARGPHANSPLTKVTFPAKQ